MVLHCCGMGCPMTSTRFGRRMAVEIGGPDLRIEGLRIACDVQRVSAAAPAQGTIDVYNLAETTAHRIRERGKSVRLYGGYDELALLADGDIRRVERRREGRERIVRMHIGGQVQAQTQAVFSGAYEGRVSLRQVVRDIVDTMTGLSIASPDSRDITSAVVCPAGHRTGTSTMGALPISRPSWRSNCMPGTTRARRVAASYVSTIAGIAMRISLRRESTTKGSANAGRP